MRKTVSMKQIPLSDVPKSEFVRDQPFKNAENKIPRVSTSSITFQRSNTTQHLNIVKHKGYIKMREYLNIALGISSIGTSKAPIPSPIGMEPSNSPTPVCSETWHKCARSIYAYAPVEYSFVKAVMSGGDNL
ncbi:hypothetical protein RhiLY_12745 [Ceratobasidium sp. AG-Ba]|nr:hypothetical protein RhiLY_12745 [Ceratobasidium sp. AG-Ba]